MDESKPTVPKKVVPASVALEAGVKIARAKLDRAKATKEMAEVNLARIKKLVESGIVPREDFIAAQQSVTVAELDLLIATAELQLAETKLKGKSQREVSPEPKPVK